MSFINEDRHLEQAVGVNSGIHVFTLKLSVNTVLLAMCNRNRSLSVLWAATFPEKQKKSLLSSNALN